MSTTDNSNSSQEGWDKADLFRVEKVSVLRIQLQISLKPKPPAVKAAVSPSRV